MNPFSKLPSRRFLLRIFFPALVVLGFGLLCLGFMVGQSTLQLELSGKSGETYQQIEVETPATQAALTHIRQSFTLISEKPRYCEPGKAVNSFQRERCREYMQALYLSWFYLLIPFLMMVVFVFVFYDQMRIFYRRAANRIQRGAIAGKGKVTDPDPPSERTWWSWLFSLRQIEIRLETGERVLAYYPIEAPEPMQGQTFAIYPTGIVGKRLAKHSKKSSWVGAFYAPHMAIRSVRD